jgi:V8-like Glu-specific endopeptidase
MPNRLRQQICPRAATARAAALCAVLFALLATGAAAAQARNATPRGDAVVHVVDSRADLRAFWDLKRMRHAEPLELRLGADGHLRRTAGTTAGDPVPAAADPSARGVDTGNSTIYPNSANGVVFGEYDISPIDDEFYRCSGSVINTSAGHVVMTSGHCVIDPDTGTPATNLIFVPGYRDGAEPFGEWAAPTFATTPEWQSSAGGPNPDEAGDIAMLTLSNRPADGATVQSIVGAFGIAFNQARAQTYMEYGYPAQFPYDGSRLYTLTSPWAGNDNNFTPATMAISSDFTGGSSGGPWLVGSSPVAMSLNDYTYGSAPGYMFGPYFGSIAQQLFVAAGGPASGSLATASTARPAAAAGTTTPVSNRFQVLALMRNASRGLAIFRIQVPGAGRLTLGGSEVREAAATASLAQVVRIPVRAAGAARRELRTDGTARVRARLRYTPDGGSTSTQTRRLLLVLRR